METAHRLFGNGLLLGMIGQFRLLAHIPVMLKVSHWEQGAVSDPAQAPAFVTDTVLRVGAMAPDVAVEMNPGVMLLQLDCGTVKSKLPGLGTAEL